MFERLSTFAKSVAEAATSKTALTGTFATFAVLTASVASADHHDREIAVVNDGYETVWEIYMPHVDDGSWGPDLLRNYVLPAGAWDDFEPARPEGYCMFDIKVVFESGYTDVVWGVNLCEVGVVRVDDFGIYRISY